MVLRHLFIFRLFFLLTLGALPALAGCPLVTTKREGKQIRQRISKLEGRLNKMKRQRRQLEEALLSAKKDQKKLSEVLSQAKKMLLRNSADLGAKVQVLEAQIGKILGRLDELEQEHKKHVGLRKKKREELIKVLKALRTDLDAFKAKAIAWHTKPKEPEGADALFEEAQKKYRLGVYAVARKYFQKFVDRHPNDARAELAMFLLAKSYVKENKFGAAEYSLRRYMKQFPKGKLVSKAWLLRARCYKELKYCKAALSLLKKLRKHYPKTKEASQAFGRIKKLRRMLGNPRYCNK